MVSNPNPDTEVFISSSLSISFPRTINTLLLNELPQFNGLALQMIWSLLGTFSCLHKDLASDMEQLFQGFAQQVHKPMMFCSAKF